MALVRQMCTTGLKKTTKSLNPEYQILEIDELYWFVGKKGRSETRENCYVIPLISRSPRQIVGIDAAFDKSPERIQGLVDAAPPAKSYATDGYLGYIDVVYPGKHMRNIRGKKDTCGVESVNADLRHYIPVLRRRSRCFPRSLETLRAVLDVFAEAYNKFGIAKMRFHLNRTRFPVNYLFLSLIFFRSFFVRSASEAEWMIHEKSNNKTTTISFTAFPVCLRNQIQKSNENAR